MISFGTSGIRGTFDKLNPSLAFKIGNVFATYLGKKIGVAQDHRITSNTIKSSLISGILAAGSDVYELGTIPSPTAEFYNQFYKLDGLFIVTASHNPPEYNGIKIVDKSGLIIKKEEANNILTNPLSLTNWSSTGSITYVENKMHYILNASKLIKSKIDKQIIVDYGNGVGSVIFTKLATRLGLGLFEINSNIDGMFPFRNSEPTEENLNELKQLSARFHKIGVAFDGDCDRLSMVDEYGNFVSGDKTFSLVVKYLYEEGNKGDVVTTLATTKTVEDIAREYGFNVRHVVIGAPYIAEETNCKDVMTGGEEVGSAIFKQMSLAKDGFLSALKILEHTESLHEAVNTLPKYYKVKKMIELTSNKQKNEYINKLSNYFDKEEKITLDGLRVDFDDWWFILRPSGTEPLLRLFVEAKSKQKAENKLKEIENIMNEF